MKNFNTIFLLTFVSLFTVFSGCALVKSNLAIRDCKFQIANVESVEYNPLQDLDKVNVKLNINCMNPNQTVEAILNKLAFNLYVNGKNIVESSITNSLKVPPQKTVSFPVNVALSASKLEKTIFEVIKSNTANYELRGTAFFSTIIGESSIPVTITKGKWSGQ